MPERRLNGVQTVITAAKCASAACRKRSRTASRSIIGSCRQSASSSNCAPGQAAARLCLVNVLAQLRAACGGDLDRVRRVLRLGGFIAAPPDFADHARVMNGASDLAVEVFGEAGRHARSTIGAPSLPGNAAVEVEGLFAVG